MLKIDVISGFLGSGKTTFIKRLLDTGLNGENVVLIENEYGAVSIDSDLLTDSKIEIKELSQGCICCSLVGDFSKSLNEVINKFNPDRILIEPSGVGKLSDIVKAIQSAGLADAINSLVCMVDAKKAKMYDKNFGEFFVDQIENAQTVILSRMDICKEENAETALEIIRKHNDKCVVVTTPISMLSDEELLKAYEGFDVNLLSDEVKHHHDHDEDECDDPNCECHHHHDHDEDECDDPECECHHHHHDEDEDEEEEHHHHHHHDHDEDECDDPECECHHHHDHDEDECDDPNCECHHHHHHHADEVFASVGIETVKKYDMEQLKKTLDDMASGKYGIIVRSKGIISDTLGNWHTFNLTPDEVVIEDAKAIPTGKIVVIGSKIDKEEIKKLF